MKIKVALLATLIFSTCHAQEDDTVPTKITMQDIYQHASFWVTKCFAPLSLEDQNFIANILHLDTQYLTLEMKVKTVFYLHMPKQEELMP